MTRHIWSHRAIFRNDPRLPMSARTTASLLVVEAHS
jgi:hypothetical protein